MALHSMSKEENLAFTPNKCSIKSFTRYNKIDRVFDNLLIIVNVKAGMELPYKNRLVV